MLFKRKPKTNEVAGPTFVEVRSAYGIAFHIVERVPEADFFSLPALCGYKGWVQTNTTQVVTAETVRAALPKQHSNWKYCETCVAAILGAK